METSTSPSSIDETVGLPPLALHVNLSVTDLNNSGLSGADTIIGRSESPSTRSNSPNEERGNTNGVHSPPSLSSQLQTKPPHEAFDLEKDLPEIHDNLDQDRPEGAAKPPSSLALPNGSASLVSLNEIVRLPSPTPSKSQRSVQGPRRPMTGPDTGPLPVVKTRYMNMLLANEKISPAYEVLAPLSAWLILAGFIVLPGTFENLGLMIEVNVRNEVQKEALQLLLKHVPLSAIAVAMSGVGVIGMISLWWRWGMNYVWVVRKVFLPCCLNGLAGVISILVNIYAINRGHWPKFSFIALIVASSISGFSLGLAIFYEFVLLQRIKREHKRQVGRHGTGRRGEGALKGLPLEDVPEQVEA